MAEKEELNPYLDPNTAGQPTEEESNIDLDPGLISENPLTTLDNESSRAQEEVDYTHPSYMPPVTSGKRWISIQAHSHLALNDWNDWQNAENGLVITTVTRPDNGSAWDEVISVEDITPYVPSEWQGPVPNSSSHLTTTSSGFNIISSGSSAYL